MIRAEAFLGAIPMVVSCESQLHNLRIRMGTHRLANKGTNCIGRDGAGGEGRGDDSGDNRRGDDSCGFETRPYVRDA